MAASSPILPSPINKYPIGPNSQSKETQDRKIMPAPRDRNPSNTSFLPLNLSKSRETYSPAFSDLSTGSPTHRPHNPLESRSPNYQSRARTPNTPNSNRTTGTAQSFDFDPESIDSLYKNQLKNQLTIFLNGEIEKAPQQKDKINDALKELIRIIDNPKDGQLKTSLFFSACSDIVIPNQRNHLQKFLKDRKLNIEDIAINNFFDTMLLL